MWSDHTTPETFVAPTHVPKQFNPVGSYRRRFELPDGWPHGASGPGVDRREVYLTFEASGCSAMTVWVNGEEVRARPRQRGVQSCAVPVRKRAVRGICEEQPTSLARAPLPSCEELYTRGQHLTLPCSSLLTLTCMAWPGLAWPGLAMTRCDLPLLGVSRLASPSLDLDLAPPSSLVPVLHGRSVTLRTLRRQRPSLSPPPCEPAPICSPSK